MNKLFLAATAILLLAGPANTQEVTRAQFTADGEAIIPENWRDWIYVGTPVTPNALNDGEAPFPEFHNVYIEPSAWAHFKATGEWAEGTQVAKELVLIRESEDCLEDGSCYEVSGRGYFMGEFAGLELEYKDSERFPDMPGGWTFFSFGHQPEPYNRTAAPFPAEACNACHEVNAETDFIFSQFYPVIRAAMPE